MPSCRHKRGLDPRQDFRGRVVIHRVAATAAIAVLAASRPAAAHPHVWIETVTGFIADHGKVSGLRVTWTFDKFFSATLLDDFDSDRDKRFSRKEVGDLEREAFRNTAKQNYFTFVKTDGVLMKGLVPRDFDARVDNGIVTYAFTLPFPQPAEPQRLSVTYYEDTYYIDVAPAEKGGAVMEGDGSLACSGAVAPDPATTIYFGSVHPLTVTLRC